MSPEPSCWSVPSWSSFDGLRHGFFGREGGVSEGAFRALNCSERVGDDAEAVRENRRRVAQALGADHVVVPVQVHGDRIHGVEEPGEADGVTTRVGSPAAGILTADCVPILLILPQARLAAAVHAGWKGTALGIARRAVERLCAASAMPPDAVHAALGPAIGACCYEVGVDVTTALGLAAAPAYVDLRALNAAALGAGGVPAEQIHLVGPCTRCSGRRLFSHRGSGGHTGRQLSAAGWF